MELGIPVGNVKEAIKMARTVKGLPIKKIDELTEKLTGNLK
jgi:hypothetical protein